MNEGVKHIIDSIFTSNGVILILGILIIFRFSKPIVGMLERIRSFNPLAGTIQFGKDDIKETVKDALNEFEYGSYQDNTAAFLKASTWVSNYLENSYHTEATVDIKITAVGMAYSWISFVDKIRVWLTENSKCKFNLSILLVNPEYLDSLPIAKFPRDWAQESRNRLEDIRNLLNSLSIHEKNRMSCIIKVYDNIPQYHGLLINDAHLFLGRTDWDFSKCPESYPVLKVGENRYRYFDKNRNKEQDRGSERIALFADWHRYYSEYSSENSFEFVGSEMQNVN